MWVPEKVISKKICKFWLLGVWNVSRVEILPENPKLQSLYQSKGPLTSEVSCFSFSLGIYKLLAKERQTVTGWNFRIPCVWKSLRLPGRYPGVERRMTPFPILQEDAIKVDQLCALLPTFCLTDSGVFGQDSPASKRNIGYPNGQSLIAGKEDIFHL